MKSLGKGKYPAGFETRTCLVAAPSGKYHVGSSKIMLKKNQMRSRKVRKENRIIRQKLCKTKKNSEKSTRPNKYLNNNQRNPVV